MRVASANLNHTTAWTTENFPHTVELLRSTRAEVIALQECPSQETLSAVADALGFDSCLHAKDKARFSTALLWEASLEEIRSGDTYAEHTWSGYTTATLYRDSWPCPLSFLSAHLSPFSAEHAVEEAQLLQSRLRRAGWPGVLLGDINHAPLVGHEPDWSQIPLHNRASRTVMDPENPDSIRVDRRVGLVFHRAGLSDVAAHMYQHTGQEHYLAPTGVHGRMRVDQIWTTDELTPQIRAYERMDPRGVTDHHPIVGEIDLTNMTPISRFSLH